MRFLRSIIKPNLATKGIRVWELIDFFVRIARELVTVFWEPNSCCAWSTCAHGLARETRCNICYANNGLLFHISIDYWSENVLIACRFLNKESGMKGTFQCTFRKLNCRCRFRHNNVHTYTVNTSGFQAQACPLQRQRMRINTAELLPFDCQSRFVNRTGWREYTEAVNVTNFVFLAELKCVQKLRCLFQWYLSEIRSSPTN